MAYDEILADRIRPMLKRRKGFSEKKMFGGVGFLLNGNMCVGVWKDSLVVRFDKEDHDETLSLPHVLPFDITGKAMKGWALVEPEGVARDEDLRRWVQLSAQYAAKLPQK
jgi:TfoX/Sxy family transcriptional regulator of competence genes